MHEDEKRRLWKKLCILIFKRKKQKIYFENQQSRKIENIGKTHRDKL